MVSGLLLVERYAVGIALDTVEPCKRVAVDRYITITMEILSSCLVYVNCLYVIHLCAVIVSKESCLWIDLAVKAKRVIALSTLR